jgi:hypothetical protein
LVKCIKFYKKKIFQKLAKKLSHSSTSGNLLSGNLLSGHFVHSPAYGCPLSLANTGAVSGSGER